MRRIKVGVIGAGGVAQVEHIPNLLKLKRQFEIIGVYDPSAKVRAFIGEEFGLAAFDELDRLLAQPLDAVVIASPDALHKEQMLAAFAKGLHVFCEKPLCYGVDDIDDVIAARDRAGKVLQVGYMKRFDPSYEAALKLLPARPKTLRYISVEVNDPDAWPFVRHHALCRGDDVPAELIAAAGNKQREQVARAVPGLTSPTISEVSTGAYCSSIVHDVNAVHGLLDASRRCGWRDRRRAAFCRRRGRPGAVSAARRPGAVEHGASRGAGARRLPRAHHALFRRCASSSSNSRRPTSITSRRG